MRLSAVAPAENTRTPPGTRSRVLFTAWRNSRALAAALIPRAVRFSVMLPSSPCTRTPGGKLQVSQSALVSNWNTSAREGALAKATTTMAASTQFKGLHRPTNALSDLLGIRGKLQSSSHLVYPVGMISPHLRRVAGAFALSWQGELHGLPVAQGQALAKATSMSLWESMARLTDRKDKVPLW